MAPGGLSPGRLVSSGMISNPAVIFEENLVLPAGISDLDGFRRWTRDEAFPKRGRIDYLAGTVEVDLKPEDLYTHGVVKTAFTARLYPLIVDTGRGNLFSDSTRIVSLAAKLSAEPDVVAVLWDSLRQGRIREVPGAKGKSGSSSSKARRTSSSRSSATPPSARISSASQGSTPPQVPLSSGWPTPVERICSSRFVPSALPATSASRQTRKAGAAPPCWTGASGSSAASTNSPAGSTIWRPRLNPAWSSRRGTAGSRSENRALPATWRP